jgi:[ribosomal protein S5]-alanine N-acetyltransferase
METERTIWTLLEEKDFPAMTEMSREKDTFRYLRKLRVMTDEEYQRFLLLKLEQIRLGTGYHWAIWLKTDRSFIGAVNLNPIWGNRGSDGDGNGGEQPRMQIGCQLKRDYWGQGFASELTRRVLDFAVGETGLSEVYGVFAKDNAVSRRLLEKLGFVWVESKMEQDEEIEIHRYPA